MNDLVSAKIFYVKNAQEISTAMLTAQPGDTLKMANGNWSNQKIVFKGNGNSSKPIYLIAETSGAVYLTGTSSLKIGGNYLLADGIVFKDGYSTSSSVIEFRDDSGNESNYCRLTNSAIIDFNPPSTSTDIKWVSLYGTHNRVDHCYLKGKTNIGTTLVVWRPTARADYHLIDSNYFGQRLPFPENGAETIRVGTSDQSQSSSFTIVEYNFFEDASGEAEIISNKSCDNIYRYNTFVGCAGALTLRHGKRCTVEGNFIFGNKRDESGGIRIIDEDHKVINNYICDTNGSSMKCALTIMDGVLNSALNEYYQVKRAVVAFNTLVNNRYNFYIGAPGTGTSLPPVDCTIANNVILATGSTNPMIQQADNPVNMKYEGNIFYGSSLGITQPNGITITNPLLSISSDGLWRISNSSPLIGKAVGDYPFVVNDMDGQIRNSPKDVGADQFSNLPIKIKPLTKHVVGPKWMQTSTGVKEIAKIPSGFSLEQNYPNPFNPSTVISYRLLVASNVILKIYDLLGREVTTLVNEFQQAGTQHSTFEIHKYTISSGVYFYSLVTKDFTQTKKMILMK